MIMLWIKRYWNYISVGIIILLLAIVVFQFFKLPTIDVSELESLKKEKIELIKEFEIEKKEIIKSRDTSLINEIERLKNLPKEIKYVKFEKIVYVNRSIDDNISILLTNK